MKKNKYLIFVTLLLFLIFDFNCTSQIGDDENNNKNSSTESSSSSSSTESSSSISSPPTIISFVASSTKVEIGTSAKLTAVFKDGTGKIIPGNKSIISGVPITVYPNTTTTYTLIVSDSAGNQVKKDINIEIYLTGKYTYKLYGSYPIEAYFSFYSTGIGNFYWRRTFPGMVDGWGGTFNYTIIGNKIDIYWKKGERSGTHSTINSFDENSLIFEGSRYSK